MIVDSTMEDSSIQILSPPPPEIIDLEDDVVSPPQACEPVTPAPVSQSLEESSTFATLPEVTQISAAITTATLFTTTLTAPTERDDEVDHVVPDLMSHFQPAMSVTPDLTIGLPSMPTAERYHFDLSTPMSSTLELERQISHARGQIPPSSRHSSGLAVHVPLTAIMTQSTPTQTLPLPTSTIQSVPISAPVTFSTTSIAFTGPGETVPMTTYMALLQQYQWLIGRYTELFATRDAILRAISVHDPFTVHVGGSLLTREFRMEIVYQITDSVLTRLQADIAGLPSTSSGQVDPRMTTYLVGRAIAEFHMRVDELFGPW